MNNLTGGDQEEPQTEERYSSPRFGRRGIIFSITASFLLIALVIASSAINIRINQEKIFINEEIPERIDRDTYDTISRDIAGLFKTSARTIGNITLRDEMPWNITNAVNKYEIFLKDIYAKSITSTINITRHEEALYLGNHSKITYGINKSWYNLTSNQVINNYELQINASSTQNITSNEWLWTANGTYIKLTIKDALGNTALINGSSAGYVNSSRLNQFSITYTNGKSLKVTLKDYLLVNTTLPINSSLTIDKTGEVYTGCIINITNQVLEMSKEYKTIVR